MALDVGEHGTSGEDVQAVVVVTRAVATWGDDCGWRLQFQSLIF